VTEEGTIVGTVGYMSPEQAEGKPIDARSDIFSFGSVLYEMLTGQRAFQGETKASTIAAILREEPKSLSQAAQGLPREVERLVKRCLRKDREHRFQTMADLKVALEELKEESDSGELREASAVGAGLVGPQGVRPLSFARQMLLLGGVLAVVAVGLAIAWFVLHRSPMPSAEITQKRLTFNSSQNPILGSAISPDGKYVAFSDSAGVHVKLLSTGDEHVIPRPAGVSPSADWAVVSWFPDGTQLLAVTQEPGGRWRTWTASLLGQSPHELREGAGAWEVSPDGTRIAISPEPGLSSKIRELWVMGSQGDNPQKVLGLGEDEWFERVHWSPDGRRLAFIRGRRSYRGFELGASIETSDLKGANRTVVVSAADPNTSLVDFCWLPDKRIVYSRLEPDYRTFNLLQVGVDAQAGISTGKPKQVTQWEGSNLGSLSASADGKRLTVQKQTFQAQVYLGELAASGTRMSPPRRLTNDEASDWPAAWTADSKAVLFKSDRNGTVGLFKQGIGQESAESVVTAAQDVADWPVVSADGAWILYHEIPRQSSTQRRLMRISANGGAPQFVMEMRNVGGVLAYRCARAPASLSVVLEIAQDEKQFTLTAFDPLNGRGKVLRTIEKDPSANYLESSLSPDGSTFAVPRTGEAEICIRLLSLSGGSDREITVKGWPNLTYRAEWSPDGRGLYCASHSPQGSTLLYVDLKGNARPLWQTKGAGGAVLAVPSPDGRYLAIQGFVANSNVWLLEGF